MTNTRRIGRANFAEITHLSHHHSSSQCKPLLITLSCWRRTRAGRPMRAAPSAAKPAAELPVKRRKENIGNRLLMLQFYDRISCRFRGFHLRIVLTFFHGRRAPLVSSSSSSSVFRPATGSQRRAAGLALVALLVRPMNAKLLRINRLLNN